MVDLNFQWRTREEKLEVVRYWWREQRGICWICKDREQPMEPYSQAVISPWAASIEHLIPKRDGGPDTVGNVRLAHRWCNNVLGALWQINQDRARLGLGPISDEWALSSRRAQLKAPLDVVRAYLKFGDRTARGELWRQTNAKYPKATRGTLQRAVEGGAVSLPRGATLPREPIPIPAYEHSAYHPPRKLTGLELARLLRQRHGPWPLA